MSIKNDVLQALEQCRGNFISGEALSETLGVTRQAVWKAVKNLIADGYEIDSSTNRGYRLSGRCDLLSAAVIEGLTGGKVYCFDSVASTNQTAKELYYSSGECVVAAERQTDGVKKDGTPFPSPRSSGVYMTAALEKSFPLDSLGIFRAQCAEQVKLAIERACGKSAQTRDVDDVYVDGKKVCGILVECTVNAAAKRVECVFVGVGIYTGDAGIPELGRIESAETRNAVIADIFNRLKEV